MMNRDARRLAADADYAATEFRDLNLWLPEIYRQNLRRTRQGVLRGLSFTNCLLEGPAVMLAVQGVELDGCNLGYSAGDMRNLVLRPVSPTTVIGPMAFENCRFVDCEFFSVGFTGSETFIQQLLQIPTEDAPAPRGRA